MKAAKTHFLIHLFAILHAATAAGCRLVGIPDEYLLTLLTITLIVLICEQEDMRINISSCAVVFGNVAAYLIGLAIAHAMEFLRLPEMVTYPLSTLLTTELLGWAVFFASYLFAKTHKLIKRTEILWLIATLCIVYATRVTVSILYHNGLFKSINNSEEILYFLFSFCTMTILVAITMTGYAISERRATSHEKEKRHLAQFQYLKLNQQVNPHFLFNSLNILDCLVADGANEQASTYIHKLSSLYRYMLSNEDEIMVKLSDEINFVNLYVDLMKVRFPEGLEVQTDLSEELMDRNIIPCSLQLLMENATKHNAIDRERPLVIRIYNPDNSHIAITNNRCPKLTPVNSTGKGLKYIRQQFMDISGKDIEIKETESDYSVILPLL